MSKSVKKPRPQKIKVRFIIERTYILKEGETFEGLSDDILASPEIWLYDCGVPIPLSEKVTVNFDPY